MRCRALACAILPCLTGRGALKRCQSNAVGHLHRRRLPLQIDRGFPRTDFPGFDGLRLLAALAAILSHAFLIATGDEASEPLVLLLGHRNIAGLYGVYTIFISSGFLLAHSLSYGVDVIQVIVNRLLRIYVAFCFCIFVTGLVCWAPRLVVAIVHPCLPPRVVLVI